MSWYTEANRDAALALSDAGFHIFPVRVFPESGRRGILVKRPALTGWQSLATTDTTRIAEWWDTITGGGIIVPGICLGVADLLLLDLDRHPGGADGVAAFRGLAAPHPRLRPPIVETATGGYHAYFKQPVEGPRMGNAKGRLPPGIDVRGAGGFSVAPGATTPWGSWCELAGWPSLTGSMTAIPRLPAWLEKVIREPVQRPEPRERPSLDREWDGESWIGGLVHTVVNAPTGERNRILFWAACRAGEHLRKGRGSRNDVFELLIDAAGQAGLHRGEAIPTIQSGLRTVGA
jgi:hypothetical protein